MSDKSQRAATGLLWFQVVCGFIFASSQAIRMLSSTQGVSVSFFLCHGSFALLLFLLSLAAYREAGPSDVDIKRQAVMIYAMWTFYVTVHLAIALWKMPDPWNSNDTMTMCIVVAGVGATIVFAWMTGRPIADPFIKAGLAGFLKCVPQITLAVSIVRYGSAGLSGVWIFMGHVTIVTRLIHLQLSRRAGRNRNTEASFWSEVANEMSWLVATAAWLFV